VDIADGFLWINQERDVWRKKRFTVDGWEMTGVGWRLGQNGAGNGELCHMPDRNYGKHGDHKFGPVRVRRKLTVCLQFSLQGGLGSGGIYGLGLRIFRVGRI